MAGTEGSNSSFHTESQNHSGWKSPPRSPTQPTVPTSLSATCPRSGAPPGDPPTPGQLCHCSTSPFKKKCFPLPNLILPGTARGRSLCPITINQLQRPTRIPAPPPFRQLWRAVKSPLSPFSTRTPPAAPSDVCSRALTALLPFSGHTPGPQCLSHEGGYLSSTFLSSSKTLQLVRSKYVPT